MVSRIAVTCACMLSLGAGASAQFQVFEGNASAEAAWRAAATAGRAGVVTIPLENFDAMLGFPCCGFASDRLLALPHLGIRFETDVPDTYPGVYADGSFAHSGVNQIANFNGGMANSSHFRILPIHGAGAGRTIRAFGFWQCDPQGDQPMHAYDADGNLVGTIVGNINNQSGFGFAGFVSSVPIARIEVTGNLGDGYNHMDDYQVVTSPPPCPADLNADGTINTLDLIILLAQFGTTCPNGAGADITADAAVNTNDLLLLLGAFGQSCPA